MIFRKMSLPALSSPSIKIRISFSFSCNRCQVETTECDVILARSFNVYYHISSSGKDCEMSCNLKCFHFIKTVTKKKKKSLSMCFAFESFHWNVTPEVVNKFLLDPQLITLNIILKRPKYNEWNKVGVRKKPLGLCT